jgi:diguanylate cyclase (GGDEF)-like protein
VACGFDPPRVTAGRDRWRERRAAQASGLPGNVLRRRRNEGVAKTRILMAEDEPHLREVLRYQLEHDGYEVIEAVDGQQALERANECLPDLVLLDVMMPHLDGYEVCRRLRSSFVTRHIPIIMLTAKTTANDKEVGLEGGANDYVTKPWQSRELLLRIRNVLHWSRQERSASPLTGLPGNFSINEEIQRRLASNKPFAMIQIDIDFFKAFNDQYGYARGDEAIQSLARILVDASRRRGGSAQNFLGHIGGDDFVILTETDHAEALGEDIIEEFNRKVGSLYDPVDRERGYVEVLNRLHTLERFPLMSLTLALVSTDRMSVSHLAQFIDIAQELKAHGKGIPGSVMVGERRHPPVAPAEGRRNVA